MKKLNINKVLFLLAPEFKKFGTNLEHKVELEIK
jgi:hypothetical protein